MTYICHKTGACPFAFTDHSEEAQAMGCLPSPYDFVAEFKRSGSVIACHEDPDRKCVGFLMHAKETGLKVPPKAPIVPNQ